MYNYKVIIADDEAVIRSNLKKLLTQEFKDIKCVAECENGKQVIDVLEKSEVEIIITDIRMPLVGGLEIAKYVKENNLKTKVILITGFSEFEYAQKAFKYEVSSFITKPIDFDELIKAVNKIREEFKEKFDKIIEDTAAALDKRELVKRYISLYMMGVVPYSKIEELSLGNKDVFSYNSCAVVNINLEGSNVESIADMNNVWSDICEISNSKINCFCISESPEEVCLLFLNYSSSEETDKANVLEHMAECQRLMYGAYGIEFLYNVEYMKQLKNRAFFDCKMLSNMYIGYMSQFNMGGINEFLRILYATTSIDNIRKFFYSVLDDMCERHLISKPQFREGINQITSLDNMLEFSKKINEEFKMISNMDHAVNKVIVYINENFNNVDLNFNHIADKLQFNRSYLSREFKKKIGQNPSEYIFNIRMENAKKLLKMNKYTLEEVATRVGYSDKGYFGQVFKKTMGVTPLKYARTGEE